MNPDPKDQPRLNKTFIVWLACGSLFADEGNGPFNLDDPSITRLEAGLAAVKSKLLGNGAILVSAGFQKANPGFRERNTPYLLSLAEQQMAVATSYKGPFPSLHGMPSKLKILPLCWGTSAEIKTALRYIHSAVTPSRNETCRTVVVIPSDPHHLRRIKLVCAAHGRSDLVFFFPKASSASLGEAYLLHEKRAFWLYYFKSWARRIFRQIFDRIPGEIHDLNQAMPCPIE